jgi:electron transfer flavoprotein alpha subunit
LIAVIPTRGAELPSGSDEAVAEAGGRVLVVGDAPALAAAGIAAPITALWTAETGTFAPGRWAEQLAEPLASEDLVVLPASPDGRDLAPRLAHRLGRPLFAGAISASPLVVVRRGGLVCEEHVGDQPAVVTLIPGSRGSTSADNSAIVASALTLAPGGQATSDAEVLEVSPPDPATMDLSEAPFIVAGGAGLGDARAFELLGRVAAAVGASLGATRVVSDAGWVPFERQIGTTGVTVNPEVYVAFGISGAVQHTSGLGDPRHVISINRDPSCPMMAMADLALVTDAPATLEALAELLGAGLG